MGHATDEEAATGCTVVLGPFRAAADVRGHASGTRQFDSLSPFHLTPAVDAICFTGGSAYGLAAADGVARWLEERGRGFETDAGRVAIVPTAVIFDLRAGGRRPDPEMGRTACEAANRETVPEGRVGAGAGASVGKLWGPASATPGGLGCHATGLDEWTVAALVVVNAFGDVLDDDGRIIAGARDESGAFVDTVEYLRENPPPPRFAARAGTNTTLALVATDAPLDRLALRVVAQTAMNAIVRHISPANTRFDGDLVIAASTAERTEEVSAGDVLRYGLCAEWALGRAIVRAVAGAADERTPAARD